MESVLPLLPGVVPYVGAAMIVLGVLGLILRSFITGALLTRAQADEIMRAERGKADLHLKTLEYERGTRDRDAESLRELLEVGRTVADGLDALRAMAERDDE